MLIPKRSSLIWFYNIVFTTKHVCVTRVLVRPMTYLWKVCDFSSQRCDHDKCHKTIPLSHLETVTRPDFEFFVSKRNFFHFKKWSFGMMWKWLHLWAQKLVGNRLFEKCQGLNLEGLRIFVQRFRVSLSIEKQTLNWS